jgi:TusA-related sulfurtransferase
MDIESIKKEIFALIEAADGKKKLKPGDVFKKIVADHPGATKDDAKAALRELMDAETLVYSYKGGSYVELPPKK